MPADPRLSELLEKLIENWRRAESVERAEALHADQRGRDLFEQSADTYQICADELAAVLLGGTPQLQDTKEEAARVAPSVPRVAPPGSIAEKGTGAVTAAERTEEERRLTELVRATMGASVDEPFRPYVVYDEAMDETEILVRDCSICEHAPNSDGVMLLTDNYGTQNVVGLRVSGKLDGLVAASGGIASQLDQRCLCVPVTAAGVMVKHPECPMHGAPKVTLTFTQSAASGGIASSPKPEFTQKELQLLASVLADAATAAEESGEADCIEEAPMLHALSRKAAIASYGPAAPVRPVQEPKG